MCFEAYSLKNAWHSFFVNSMHTELKFSRRKRTSSSDRDTAASSASLNTPEGGTHSAFSRKKSMHLGLIRPSGVDVSPGVFRDFGFGLLQSKIGRRRKNFCSFYGELFSRVWRRR